MVLHQLLRKLDWIGAHDFVHPLIVFPASNILHRFSLLRLIMAFCLNFRSFSRLLRFGAFHALPSGRSTVPPSRSRVGQRSRARFDACIRGNGIRGKARRFPKTSASARPPTPIFPARAFPSYRSQTRRSEARTIHVVWSYTCLDRRFAIRSSPERPNRAVS